MEGGIVASYLQRKDVGLLRDFPGTCNCRHVLRRSVFLVSESFSSVTECLSAAK